LRKLSTQWNGHLLKKTLQFYGFGPSPQKWIKAFYCDIGSTVTNNGHVSDFFSLGRGGRQSDPLSPYLFILVLELLSAAIKNDPETTGVKINDSEYLLSQYADDSSLILDDNPKSLDQSLFMFNKFSECAGLRVILTRPKQHGLAQGGVAMNSSFQINIYHGTFLENFTYWILV
jgi:hypothetical protein